MPQSLPKVSKTQVGTKTNIFGADLIAPVFDKKKVCRYRAGWRDRRAERNFAISPFSGGRNEVRERWTREGGAIKRMTNFLLFFSAPFFCLTYRQAELVNIFIEGQAKKKGGK